MFKQTFKEQGQSMVEAAFMLPILLILFLGIAEVGFLLFAHVQVANAAREGARYGSLCRYNGTCFGDADKGYKDLTEVVKYGGVFPEVAPILNMDDSNTTVNVQPSLTSAPSLGSPITVTVTYNHSSLIVSNFIPMFPAEMPIEHRVVMLFDK
jgi:Flp pilus assembly protein TadG